MKREFLNKQVLELILSNLKDDRADKLETAVICEEFDEAGKRAWDVGYADAIAEIEALYIEEFGISPPPHPEWDALGQTRPGIYSDYLQGSVN